MGIVDMAVKRIMGMVPLENRRNRQMEWEGGPVGIQINDEEAGAIEEYPLRVEQVLVEGEDVLGCYRAMNSPGLITLYWERIGQFFWQIALDINRMGYYMESQDFERMAHMAVYKTYTHEQFHHFCDVARYLCGSTKDRMTEEALAVAWSYRQVQAQRGTWQSKEARLSSPFYSEMMRRMYRYTGPGYRDWVQYQTEDDFLDGIARYLGSAHKDFLSTSGLNVGRILLAMVNEVKDKGVVEEVV